MVLLVVLLTILDVYYQEPELDALANPLVWWKAKKDSYPILAKIARKLLARPSTSVPCERLWSEAGNIVNDLRTCLDPDSLSMLTFIQHNVRELKKIRKEFVWKSDLSVQ